MNLQEINLIKEKIKEAEVISFDIFDTLILRLFNKPEDVFLAMEKKLNINNFCKMRIDSQHKASIKVEREKKYPHANINEIYEQFVEDSEYKNANRIKEFEIQLEVDNIVCNYEIYALYQYALSLGKRVIAVSDMYISQNDIKKMLYKCGYKEFSELYVSSDYRMTKYNGDLYTEVLKMENLSSNNLLHIGDNYVSDYKNAKSKGIEAVHYNCINESIPTSSTDICSSINQAAINILNYFNQEESFWFKSGVKIGGSLYTGLIQWITKSIKESKYNKVYFLSRDGYILYNLLKELGYTDIEYVYTSRRALLLAAIDKLDENALNNLPPFTYGQTVENILSYIKCEHIDDKSVMEAGFSSRYDCIKNQEDFRKMKKLYLSNEELILEVCKTERENAKRYFNSIGLLDANSAIFDCGWNGSSQYLLDNVLSLLDYNGRNKFYYAGIMNTDKARRQLSNREFDTYLFGFNYNMDIEEELKKAIVIPELFFSAPHNSIWYYGKEENIFENDSNINEHTTDIYRGIQAYINFTNEFLEKYKIEFTPKTSVNGIIQLINNPTNDEAKYIGNIKNIDGFVTQKGKDKFIAKLYLEDIIKNPNCEIYWPQGLLARKDISPIVKYYVKKKFNIKTVKSKKGTINTSNILYKVCKVLIKEGPLTLGYFAYSKLKRNTKSLYDQWIRDNEKDLLDVTNLEYTPLISIVVPVYNVLDNQLSECIDSVLAQTYKNWELCLVDDASTWESVRTVLNRYEKHNNIHIIYRKENGHISRATNDGIDRANGEFVAFLDCDDILAPNALYEMAKKLNENKKYDFIYSDEDKLTADGTKRHSPFFKPDWSPDTFMSLMYTCHFSLYRLSIIKEIGGLRVGVEGAQDYDFTLRFTEKANLIGHIPKILYHWRERNESIASNPESKPYALEAVKKSKEDALKRRGLSGTVEYVRDMYQYRVTYDTSDNPLVSIIIPSKDNYDILENCLKSIKKYTTYTNYELIIVDNGSSALNKEKYTKLCLQYNCIYHYEPMIFNFSKMCNIGANISNGSLLLFLNDDIEICTENWLATLVGHASLEHVGAVGAKLLYPNSNIIQHIGITNLAIGPSHSQIGFDDRVIYYYGRNRMDYNYIAVTAACLMMKKNKFYEIEGFDEKLTIAYNDVDLCFKLIEQGYYNVVRNDVTLYHHESISRGSDDIDIEKKARLKNERERLYKKHPNFVDNDPFYNINLTECKVNYETKLQEEKNYNRIVRASKYTKDIKSDGNHLVFLDYVNNNSNSIDIEGWTFIDKSKWNNLNKIYVVLIDENSNKIFIKANKVFRPDVTNAFGRKYNLNFVGFKCCIDTNTLNETSYKVGILVKSYWKHKKYMAITEKNIVVTK